MDMIKGYLESMFANYPNTPEVVRAKSELLQMMEDKYSELISEGKNENEAIGTVISEFGNLDEIAESLGISQIAQSVAMAPARRKVTLDEIKSYLETEKQSASNIALGVACCIVCVVPPIIAEMFGWYDIMGVLCMFALITAGVIIFIWNGRNREDWAFLKKELCVVDRANMDYILEKKNQVRDNLLVQKTVGIILCALCWLPSAILDEIPIFSEKYEDVTGILLFLLVAGGVFLIVQSSIQQGSFTTLLKLNENGTMGSTFVPETEKEVYSNPTVDAIMSVYWPTVTCLYLIWSFLTFDWWISWIIWPVASIVRSIIKKNYADK
ncbi:MAG: permease prefix domain 1-containing protein [Lachnospiraceae bacterium]